MSATEIQGTPPAGDVEDDLQLVLPGRGLPAGAGISWIGEGWQLFARAPLMWIVSLVLVFLVALALGFVPVIGQVAFQLLQPVIAAGFMVACRSLEKGGEFELEHLMQGFSKRLGPLVIVGLIFMLAWLAVIVVVGVAAGVAALGTMSASDPVGAVEMMVAQPIMVLLFVLIVLAIGLPITAAYWFAPVLVMMHGVKPVAAMKESFFACFRNIVPFILYGLVMMVGAILAVIPFGLGMLVWLPVAIASTYAAYRQIFTEE